MYRIPLPIPCPQLSLAGVLLTVYYSLAFLPFPCSGPTVYSLIALKDILPDEQYGCWHTFVQAFNIMCSRAISKSGVSLMDHHLVSLCNQVEQLFGVGGCTPNLHMHGYLLECLFDYGLLAVYF